MLELRRALTYAFRSHAWWKTALFGSLVAAIPYVGPWFVFAHLLPITEQVAEGDDEHLPGFALLPLLPAAIKGVAAIYFWLLFVVFIVTLAAAIPIYFAAIILWILFTDEMLTVGLFAHVAAVAAAILISLVLQQVCFARLAVTSSFHESTQLRLAWRLLRARPGMWIASSVIPIALGVGPLLVGYLGIAGVSRPSGILGGLALGPISLFARLVEVHLIGQAYRASAHDLAGTSGRRMRRRLSIGGLLGRRGGHGEPTSDLDFPPAARKPVRRR